MTGFLFTIAAILALVGVIFGSLSSAILAIPVALLAQMLDARRLHAEQMAAMEDLAGFLRIVAQNSYREPPVS